MKNKIKQKPEHLKVKCIKHIDALTFINKKHWLHKSIMLIFMKLKIYTV